MPITVEEAWILVEDARKSLQSSQLLSARKQKNVLHALKTLRSPLPEMVDPHLQCSPSMQKRCKFYHFLHAVLHTCGPHAGLVSAIALTQTAVSGMRNDHRSALCQKIASHTDWPPATNPHLQSFAAQFRELRRLDGVCTWTTERTSIVLIKLVCKELERSQTKLRQWCRTRSPDGTLTHGAEMVWTDSPTPISRQRFETPCRKLVERAWYTERSAALQQKVPDRLCIPVKVRFPKELVAKNQMPPASH